MGTPALVYFNQQSNKAFHNLCITLCPPPNLTNLLGLGEKFCLEWKRPKIDTVETIKRLKHSIRLRHWLQQPNNGYTGKNSVLAHSTSITEDYIPNLYIKSKWIPPAIQTGTIKTWMMEFATFLKLAAIAWHQARARSNLSSLQHRQITMIRNDTRFTICLTDKNLGPAILERQQYIHQVHHDHLGHADTYKRLSKTEATDLLARTSRSLPQAYRTHCNDLPQA
jgi:hypothetical protein